MKNLEFVSKKIISLNTKTWSKDIRGLFDYESSEYILNEFEIEENTILSR